jgi:ribosomal subunit interface protein
MDKNIQVIGRQVEIAQSLTSHAKNEIIELVTHYKINFTEGVILFSKPLYALCAEISLHLGKGVYLRAQAEGETAFFAFDNAFAKLKRNLQKYKRRLVDHHKHRDQHTDKRTAVTRVLSPHSDDDNTPIIAEMKESFSFMTLENALATMELEGKAAFIFRNSTSKNLNILYRRTDGNIGWIDPQLQEETI